MAIWRICNHGNSEHQIKPRQEHARYTETALYLYRHTCMHALHYVHACIETHASCICTHIHIIHIHTQAWHVCFTRTPITRRFFRHSITFRAHGFILPSQCCVLCRLSLHLKHLAWSGLCSLVFHDTAQLLECHLPTFLKGCGWLLLPLMYLSHFDIIYHALACVHRAVFYSTLHPLTWSFVGSSTSMIIVILWHYLPSFGYTS